MAVAFGGFGWLRSQTSSSCSRPLFIKYFTNTLTFMCSHITTEHAFSTALVWPSLIWIISEWVYEIECKIIIPPTNAPEQKKPTIIVKSIHYRNCIATINLSHLLHGVWAKQRHCFYLIITQQLNF